MRPWQRIPGDPVGIRTASEGPSSGSPRICWTLTHYLPKIYPSLAYWRLKKWLKISRPWSSGGVMDWARSWQNLSGESSRNRIIRTAFCWGNLATSNSQSAEVEELDSRIAFQLRHRDGLHKEKMAEMQEKYSHWVVEWCGFHKGLSKNHWENGIFTGHKLDFGDTGNMGLISGESPSQIVIWHHQTPEDH